jgi:biopolymer transport protein ExbD
MAEVNSSAGADRHQGSVRCKKLSTRVDLTPMVDLGFLLITFFIFTYHISTPQALDLVMPTEKGDSLNIGESTALTIVAADNNKLFYYHGSLEEALQKGLFGFTNYSLYDGVGNIIRAKQIALDKIKPDYRNDLMLVIKPAENARYENLVNILDEVLINDVAHYAIVDITSEEEKVIVENANGR